MKRSPRKTAAPENLSVPIVYAEAVQLRPGWVMCWMNGRMHTGVVELGSLKEGPSHLRALEFRLPVELKKGSRPTITASVYQTSGPNNGFRTGSINQNYPINERYRTQVVVRAEQVNGAATYDEVWCDMVAICEGRLIDLQKSR